MTNVILRWMGPADLGIDKPFDSKRFAKVVGRIDLTEGMFHLAHVNNLVGEPALPSAAELVNLLQQLNLSRQMGERIRNYVIRTGSPFLVSRPQLIESMKCLALLGKHVQNGHSKAERLDDFLRLILHSGEYQARQRDSMFFADPSLDVRERWKKALPALRGMSKWAHSSFNPLSSFGHLKLLLLDKVFKDPSLVAAFKNSFSDGMTLEEFALCISAVACVGFRLQKDSNNVSSSLFTLHNLAANLPSHEHLFERFLNYFSVSPQEIRQNLGQRNVRNPEQFFDFKILRERPILRSQRDTFIIADRHLFCQLASVGPLFRASRVLGDNVLAKFGQAFEEYGQETIGQHNESLKECGKDGSLSFNKRVLSKSLRVDRELADVAVVSGESLILIESKAVWLQDALLSSTRADEFWNHLLEKFGVTVPEGTSEESRKGAAQLADSIKTLAQSDAVVSDNAFKPHRIKTIFPVLLVHDDTLNASGFANMLAGEFAQLLGESDFSQTGYSEFKNFRVANLSLITIDELEALVSIGVEKSMIEHLEQFTAKDPGRLLYSFGDYLLELPDKKNPKEPLSRVMGRSVLEQARKEFFPTRPPLV